MTKEAMIKGQAFSKTGGLRSGRKRRRSSGRCGVLQEKFTGCRVVSYCLMCNHFHLLLEVPAMPTCGLADEALLKRLSAIYSAAFVARVAKELAEAGTAVHVEESGLDLGYFTDGAVIGSRRFVDEALMKSRERFESKRKTGARRLKGDSEPASRVALT